MAIDGPPPQHPWREGGEISLETSTSKSWPEPGGNQDPAREDGGSLPESGHDDGRELAGIGARAKGPGGGFASTPVSTGTFSPRLLEGDFSLYQFF
jgi:hypothetical protein